MKCFNKVNYFIDIPGRRQKVVHINNLKEHRQAEAVVRRVVIGQEDEVNVEEQKAGCKLSGRVLDEEQKKELVEVLGKYSELFSGKPGKTKIDQHVIHTGDEMPIRSQAYRVPLHWKEEFWKEIEHMLEVGVIEPSKSPWASPTVPVRKFDGGCEFVLTTED